MRYYFCSMKIFVRILFGLSIFACVCFAQSRAVLAKDGKIVGAFTVERIDGYEYVSTDALVSAAKGARYFAADKFKESLRLWGVRAVFTPENPFVMIDGVPYNVGLPVTLTKSGLLVPVRGFFEAFARGAGWDYDFSADTIKLSTSTHKYDITEPADGDTKIVELPKTTTTDKFIPSETDANPRSTLDEETTIAANKKTSTTTIAKVVVDAGHGGKDPGAVGKSGLREKDITLAIAKELANLLKDKGFEVILTRDSDRFLALSERTKKANEAKGDLFVSVHCNASKKPTATGTQGFYLSPAKTDEARAAAALENEALLLEDEPIVDNIDDLQYIMADMLQSKNQRESSILAYMVEQKLAKTLSLESRGPQGANFYVLYGAFMPAILVEVAFISNVTEEKLLSSAKTQKNAAKAIADGVEQYFLNIHK